jgi:Peptidase family M1 domain
MPVHSNRRWLPLALLAPLFLAGWTVWAIPQNGTPTPREESATPTKPDPPSVVRTQNSAPGALPSPTPALPPPPHQEDEPAAQPLPPSSPAAVPPVPVPPPPPPPAPAAVSPPPWLPCYDLDICLDVPGHKAVVHQRVTWTNRHQLPAQEIVFNAHSRYTVPKKDIGLIAKTLEIMRMKAGDCLLTGDPPLEVQKVHAGDLELPFGYRKDNTTALVVNLPHPVLQGDTITLDLDFVFHLPQKQGRWGQWLGVTYLSNWLPVLAFYDDHGWQPTPFIPWHQPFFNEAGNFRARVLLPCDHKVACSGSVVAETDAPPLPGAPDVPMKQIDIVAPGVRDFALLASARYREYAEQVGPVRVKVIAFPEHEHYARMILRTACDVLPVYSQWFGPYPWQELTFAESYFGWNGNECATLVMIDERAFNMPHLAEGYIEYLICHETCHQWWYNLIGTNGYCETWMDEAMANYFSHRHFNRKHGRNNDLLHFPEGLGWLPNIRRENYRFYSMYGTLGRGEECPIVQDMPDFKHVITLFSMCYDKGGLILAMIEDRLGEAGFIDFLHVIYQRYQFRILRVADFQHELEEFTGRSWAEFFRHWLYGAGFSDWAVEKVEIEPRDAAASGERWGAGLVSRIGDFLATLHPAGDPGQPCKVRVLLHQRAEYNEQTWLGICLDPDGPGEKCDGPGYRIRIPIVPQAPGYHTDDPPACVQSLPDNRVLVEVELPCRPSQIAVDPDQIVPDRDPSNNFWKPCVRCRFTPLYTFLDETTLTNDYDRWNFIAGPWLYGSSWDDPWYTRASLIGVRAGLYRTESFTGGVYAAYRTSYRDLVAGADGLWDHWPWHMTQVGFNVEQRLASFQSGENRARRASVFGRYVFQYGDSFYQAPMHYLEAFGDFQDDFLPFARHQIPNPCGCPGFASKRWDHMSTGGLHWHINYLTPYWDAEGGFQADVSYAGGGVKFTRDEPFHSVTGQLSFVKSLPELDGPWSASAPWLGAVARWLSDTRFAFRGYGATAVPEKGQFFSLGGSELFRGFDMRERQGSTVWVGSVEWRVPLAEHVEWDACDHVLGVRNVYAAGFYDVGDAVVSDHTYGPVAHALGLGLRVDTAWLSLVEHTTLRFDMAKTVNSNAPWQFWFGIQHPF